MFQCSNLFMAKAITRNNQFFVIPLYDRTHYFSSIVDSSFNAVYYLIKTCGLSPECAKSASMKVNFDNPKRPDLVIELLNKYGFSKTQISVIARRCPTLLSFDPDKTLLPKLEFFKSIGVYDITKVLSSNPFLLLHSLDNRLIPTYSFLKSVVVSDEKMVTLCERSSWVFYSKSVIPNITLLRKLAVPLSSIELLLNHHQISIIQNHELFRVAVDKVKEMGFDPVKSAFVLAVRVLSGKSSTLIWNRCSKEYKKWGWSDEDILLVFKKNPSCMIMSEEKIEKTMCFLVDKFGWESKMVANFPNVFNYNLEKRIIPRCLVIQVLSSKGLLKKISLGTILLPSDKLFLERYVTRYVVILPHLRTVYQGDADIRALKCG